MCSLQKDGNLCDIVSLVCEHLKYFMLLRDVLKTLKRYGGLNLISVLLASAI